MDLSFVLRDRRKGTCVEDIDEVGVLVLYSELVGVEEVWSAVVGGYVFLVLLALGGLVYCEFLLAVNFFGVECWILAVDFLISHLEVLVNYMKQINYNKSNTNKLQ